MQLQPAPAGNELHVWTEWATCRRNKLPVSATKVAPGDKLRNVEHVQLWATCYPNNTTRPNRQQVACLDGALLACKICRFYPQFARFLAKQVDYQAMTYRRCCLMTARWTVRRFLQVSWITSPTCRQLVSIRNSLAVSIVNFNTFNALKRSTQGVNLSTLHGFYPRRATAMAHR